MSAAYTYNGDGLRTLKTVATQHTTRTGIRISTKKTAFRWNVSTRTPLAIAIGPAYMIYGPAGVPVEQINGKTPTFYSHDQLGGTTLFTDVNGNPLATFKYSSYGKTIRLTGKKTSVLLYAGEYQDSETGFYYLRNRYYDPATAQFTTVDPLAAIAATQYRVRQRRSAQHDRSRGTAGDMGQSQGLLVRRTSRAQQT